MFLALRREGAWPTASVQLFSAMPKPRCVLVVESPALAQCYQSALAGVGFEVNARADGESALAALRPELPALMAVDPLLPTMDAAELIRTVRTQPGADGLPVLVLPAAHAPLVEVAVQAGATRAIDRAANAPRALTDLAKTICRLPSSRIPPAPTDHWVSGALEHVVQLRGALHGLMREAGDRASWHALLRHAHALAELLTLGREPALARLATTAEWLVHDLAAMPEQLNSSVLRTLGQAADFLSARLAAGIPTGLSDLAGARVLSVEDDTGAGLLVAAAMHTAGLAAEIAATPAAGLAATEQGRFELIFLDIGLPEMNGFDLCTRLRGTPGHDRVPIIFLTGMATFQNRAQASLTGGNDFIGKPFHPLELGLKAQLCLCQGRAGQPV
jgi:DNA-binding response OmpR family regulator